MPLLFFFLRNHKAFPILAVEDAGDPRLSLPGAAIDIQTRPPRYRSASFPRLSRPSLPSRAGRERSVGGARAEGGPRGMRCGADTGVVQIWLA